MPRLLFALSALALFGVALGCETLGGDGGGACGDCCDACGTPAAAPAALPAAPGAMPAAPMPKATAAPIPKAPAGAPAGGAAAPESIREMPRVNDEAQRNTVPDVEPVPVLAPPAAGEVR
jgi:hypothetical protein